MAWYTQVSRTTPLLFLERMGTTCTWCCLIKAQFRACEPLIDSFNLLRPPEPRSRVIGDPHWSTILLFESIWCSIGCELYITFLSAISQNWWPFIHMDLVWRTISRLGQWAQVRRSQGRSCSNSSRRAGKMGWPWLRSTCGSAVFPFSIPSTVCN